MKTTKALFAVATMAAFAVVWTACSARLASGGIAIDRDDIAGVVMGASGPEAGVWVIAETSDLPTKFAKIVVTDDQGRYLLPDLPQASYDVWVRGYGLIDSPKQRSEPGKTLNLEATMGFYTKWLDGRIDDPDAGWKGRGLWASISTRAPFHMEGGKGTTPKAYRFQLRPHPLAK